MVRRILSMIAASAMALLAVPSTASAEIFVAGVEGDATARGHEKEIVATQVTFGSTSSRSSIGVAKVMAQTVVFTHRVDRASPQLFKNAVSAARVPLLKIELTKNTGTGTPVTFLRISLKNARIVSLSQSGTFGGGTEQVTVVFDAATLQYIPISQTGVAGAPVNVTWDLVKNMVSQ